MSRKCDICGKGLQFGGSYVRRGKPKKEGGIGLNVTGRSKRVFRPNLQVARIDLGGVSLKIKACTACIKAGKTIVVPE